MPFPVGWPPPSVQSIGPSMRFFRQGTATSNFDDNAFLFWEDVGSTQIQPLPTIIPGTQTPFQPPAPISPSSPTAVHAAYAGTAANTFPGPFGALDVPRSVTVTFASGWQGGDIMVSGLNLRREPQFETFPSQPGITVEGKKIFTSIYAASKTAQAGSATASIGTGISSTTFSIVPRNPGTLYPGSYIFANGLRICNDSSSVNLEYSFDGSTVHGVLLPDEQVTFLSRYEAGIALRGAEFRCEAW